MTRVRMDLFASLDGYTPKPEGATPQEPMGPDWGRLTAAWAGTRTFHEKIFGDTSGAGTIGVDDAYARAFFENIGAEIMGAGMFGLHTFPDDPEWKGWWGDRPSFGTPVYVLTHGAQRPPIDMEGGTTFHFRDASVEEVLAEATEAASASGKDVRIGGGYETARSFLRAGLVDDLHLMVAPIFLGRGHRLFDDLAGFDSAYTVTSEVAETGVIHVTLTR